MMNPGGVWLMGAMTDDGGYAALSRYVYQSGGFGNLTAHYSVNPEGGLGVNNRAGVRFIVTDEQLILEEEKIQADWEQNDSAKPDYIKNKPEITAPYELPEASANTLGGVKVGENLTVSNGVLKSKYPTVYMGAAPPSSGFKDGDIFILTVS